MKKTTLFLFLLFTSFLLKGQILVEEGKIWSIARFPTIGNHYYTYHLKIEGDTIIGNCNYKKLLSSNDSLMLNWKLDELIRQDSGLVFTYNQFSKDEQLLYNFNLNVGDSFVSSVACKFIVDSIKLKNKLKYFYLSAHIDHHLIWIENIGCVDGLLVNSGNCDIVGDSSILLCCKIKDSLIFQNANYSNCYIQYTGIENRKLNSFKLYQNYPNPFNYSTIINIEFRKIPINTFLNIYTTEGILLKRFYISQQKNEIEIKSDDFKSKGIYFYNLISEDGYSKMMKLVIY